jgi:glycosyltransferase involved in cell wall biosynthesis
MLSDMPKTALVIPCYNEEKRLSLPAFKAAMETYPELTFYFVDDGSADNTYEILHEFSGNYSRAKVLRLEKNAGKAVAVRHGILASIKDGNVLTGFWDADLATPLSEMKAFIRELADSDVEMVMGCRLAHLGSKVRRKASRHYLGRAFATTVAMLLSMPVYDTQCGAKLMKAELAAKLFDRPLVSAWLFDVELIKRMKEIYGIPGCETKIIELPLRQWNDVAGSKLKLSKMLLVPFVLLRIFSRRS